MDSGLRDCAQSSFVITRRLSGVVVILWLRQLMRLLRLLRSLANDIVTQSLRGNDFLSVMLEVFPDRKIRRQVCRVSREQVWIPAFETVPQSSIVITRRLSGGVVIPCVRQLMRLLRSPRSLAMTQSLRGNDFFCHARSFPRQKTSGTSLSGIQGVSMDSRLRDCVAILFCHYVTPLRRRGNPMCAATYEIASVAALPRNDTVSSRE